MGRDLRNWGNKGSVMVNGVKVETFKNTFTSCNEIDVEVGTTGYQGGDTGHGGRTFLRISDASSTDIAVRVKGYRYDKGEYEEADYGNLHFVEIGLGGDSELETFYEALQFAVEVLGQHTSGISEYEPELSPMEQRQMIFANYLNEVCDYFRKNCKKLRGFSDVKSRYSITPISQQQFFECELHKAAGYIPQEFCNRVYAYVLDGGKTLEAPKYMEE